jgi:hypothetical protein
MRSRPQPGAVPLKYRAALRRRVNRFTLPMIFCVRGRARPDPSPPPLYVRVFGINLVLFRALNGYLRRRGYFEVVALRRLDAAAARAMRNRFAGRIATAFSVHVFEMLPGAPPQPAVRSTA